jgi:DNA-cytosine methyltransferase
MDVQDTRGTDEFIDVLPDGTWSEAVALDPKHRPQTLDKPSTTVRREWARWPQEAHLLDEANNRYRRLSLDEIAAIQGFDTAWFEASGINKRDAIAAIGNAVPPPLAQIIFETIDSKWTWENSTSLEICSGMGGLASGVATIAGMQHLGLVEYWPPACEILRHRGLWSPDIVYQGDVQEFDFAQFDSRVGVFAGGPPCQPWSQAGRRQGHLDERDLLGIVPDILARCQPEVFVIENVPGLISSKEQAVYVEDLVTRFAQPDRDGLKYGVAKGILNAADYGVPQKRRRVFFLGFRGKSHTFASGIFRLIKRKATHSNPLKPVPGCKPWVTLGEAFKSIPDPGGWRTYLNTDRKEQEIVNPINENEEETIKVKSIQPPGCNVENPTKGDSIKAANSLRSPSIMLSWPTKGEHPRQDGDKWLTEIPIPQIELCPLILRDRYRNIDELNPNMVIVGDRLQALNSLSPMVRGEVRLAYMDAPRIKTFASQEEGYRNSVWMSVVREYALAARSQLSLDGVFIVHANDASYHYARMVLEEVFGAVNYVCTIIWQKKYGPQNDLDVPTDAQDYLVVFANDKRKLPLIGLPAVDEELTDDGDPRGPWRAGHKGARSGSEETKFEVNVPPYRWELSEGKLPPGIWRISPMSGVIWGKPEKTGTYKFKVRVTDKNGAIKETGFCIRVLDPKKVPPEGEEPERKIQWLWETTRSKGNLRMTTSDLPDAYTGREYSAVIEATGGDPFIGKKKPGSGRYWEFSPSTLEKGILADNTEFGRRGGAIPSIKKHQDPDEGFRIRRITTWWPHEAAGKSEDATKHLQELADRGLVDRVERIAKPELLMKRLLHLFTRQEGDLVLIVDDPTASLTATAIKLKRRVVHLTGEGTQDIQIWEECAFPRLRAVLDGQDDLGISPDEDVQWDGGGWIDIFGVGCPFLVARPNRDEYHVDLESYPIESDSFVEALCAISGFRRVEGREIDGIAVDGTACIVLRDGLNLIRLGRIASEIAPQYEQLTILYERSDLPENMENIPNILLKHIPFDLVG